MKLFTRYYRVNLLSTIVVMLLTSMVYYWAISRILIGVADKDLVVEESEIFEYVRANHRLPQVFESKDQQISFAKVSGPVKREYINTSYYNPKERENEQGRGLISSVNVNGVLYKIVVVQSSVETDDLIRVIFSITIVVVLLLLFVLLMVNRLVLGRIWQPFYGILQQVKAFNVAEKNDIAPQRTNIDEFNELNDAITSMATRVKKDYGELKAFTENASHELLTPIAIINSKLDTLVQTENFNERQSMLLNDLYTSVSRLTRLNQSMLLLARIENQVISGYEPVNLKWLLEEKVAQLQELYADKEINVSVFAEEKEVQASRYLVEILVNNLLVNAIKHNVPQGQIDITLTKDKLVIKNTGEDRDMSTQDIFKRFSKSANSEGTGLGLTISTQICGNYDWMLDYRYRAPFHYFTVVF
ncbi:HAMP domain-containing histidine kinase [Mucilaginibacter mali]|uniref:histidine kinase n=1 Tax=Mucilaginibacter mali TaxID=2740462 RepID=A0A7D4UGF9_9SPHI|nr:HAMP domain-containing sensor histidine kinase [Mucilaginibacter mali]QKJ31776.1 HAMP domain-containing histidine kinase [Mucilaginibacter mali]